MPVTSVAAARFAAFGFTVLRGTLTSAECRAIAGEFTRAFQQAYPNLRERRTPAWLPGLADATPRSAELAVDDGRLWDLSRELLGGDSLPVPPEVAVLRGITPWHYDDPLGLRGVKFLCYVSGPAAGVRLLPLSHGTPQRAAVTDYLAAMVGDGRAARTQTEAVEQELVPAVPVTVAPGDLVAIDLHVWHSYQVAEPRILWSPEYIAWPVDPPDPKALDEKLAAVAAAGVTDQGTEWPVWRDWLRDPPPSGNRQRAIDLLRSAGAFAGGRDRS